MSGKILIAIIFIILILATIYSMNTQAGPIFGAGAGVLKNDQLQLTTSHDIINNITEGSQLKVGYGLSNLWTLELGKQYIKEETAQRRLFLSPGLTFVPQRDFTIKTGIQLPMSDGNDTIHFAIEYIF